MNLLSMPGSIIPSSDIRLAIASSVKEPRGLLVNGDVRRTPCKSFSLLQPFLANAPGLSSVEPECLIAADGSGH